MNFEKKLEEVQASLIEQDISGWLLFDFHRSNSLACSFLQIPSQLKLTRRFFYWIPQQGEPIKIVSAVEPHSLDHLPGTKWLYKGWQEIEFLLLSLLKAGTKVAMEYSPYQALPSLSKVDAGVVELVRKMGPEVVSSGNILQRYTSVWTQEQWESHCFAAKALENIVERTWRFIEQRLQNQEPLDECLVQKYMWEEIEKEGCETADKPICAVNQHSADPHYAPHVSHVFPIQVGDVVLLDIWCKQKVPNAVYADIARVGIVASEPTPKQQEVFQVVKQARDKATLFVQENYENQRLMQGWQVDKVCRDVIQEMGYGDYFVHRTGHNLGEEVHGAGANLDNLETHDDRQLLPGTAFTIEPGIYLPGEFGVRLEYDVYLDPSGKVQVTGGKQENWEFLKFNKPNLIE